MTARSWTLTIPAPAPWLNANQRVDLRAQTPDRRAWRDAAHVWAKAAKLPRLHHVHIVAVFHFRENRRRDIHNWYPTIKACVDGLIDYELLPDDSTKYLIGPDLRVGDPSINPVGSIDLTITELTAPPEPQTGATP